MDAQLMTLLQIQDLRSQIKELQGSEMGTLEQETFKVDPAEAVELLRQRVGELESQLDLGMRRRLERITARLDRVVAPVINGVCYGCFTSVATAVAAEHLHQGVHTCETCGRFIYVVS